MRTICINLDRARDRWESIEKQAAAICLSIERFSAVDGAALPHPPNSSMSAGALGCFLSHRAIWQEISRGSDDYVLVLEDDAVLSPELPRFLDSGSWIPEDADIVHIGGMDRRCFVKGLGRPIRGRKLFRSVRCTGGEAYIISRRCAAQLVRELVTVDKEFDQIVLNGGRPDLNIYKLLPALCTQNRAAFTSSIERQRRKPRLPAPERFRQKLAHARHRFVGLLQLKHRRKVLYG